MTTDTVIIERSKLEQWLEALELWISDTDSPRQRKAIADIEEALAQPEQEQVIECDCITSIAPNGLRQTKCGSDQMRRAVQEGAAFSKQLEHEPVAVVNSKYANRIEWKCTLTSLPDDGTRLYTTPPQRKPLTDEVTTSMKQAGLAACVDTELDPTWEELEIIYKAMNKAAHGIKG